MTRRDILLAGAGVATAALTDAGAGAGVNPRPLDAKGFLAALRSISTPSGSISYFEQGAGPAALFLHGWPLNGYHWRDSIAALSPRRRCIAPDFMGLGYTEVHAGQDLSPVAQAEMLVQFLGALRIEQVDIVANDSGTGVAQLLAVRNPGLVRSMLLTNGDVHTNSPPEALKPAIEAARRGELADVFQKNLTTPGFSVSPEGLGAICYTDPRNLTAEAMQVYLGPLLASPLRRAQCQAYGVAFEPNPLPAIERELRSLEMPVRMLWGTGDVHFGVEWAEWLARALPNSRGVRLVEGGKLFFTEERPELVVEEAGKLWS